MILRDRIGARRFAVISALVLVAVGTFVVPVEAGMKKKSKPQSFEAEGTLLTAHPLTLRRMGVTRNEFLRNCTVPQQTQGVDGYVIEVPEAFTTIASETYVTGKDALAQPDLDMYYFNEACEEIDYTATGSFSETGVMPAGTHFVLVAAFVGGGSSEFIFEAVEIGPR